MSQSPPAWRVFDAPTDASTAAEPTRGSAVTLAQPNVLLAAAALVGALLVGGVALVVAIGSGTGTTIEGPDTPAGRGESTGPEAVTGEIVVDVAGAVAKPGLYRLPSGARVGDAIEAAGGFGPRVDVDRVALELNLAAALADGAQVRVPSRDDQPPTSAGPGLGGNGGSSNGGGAGGLLNLNTATQAELEALPGIGPVTASKILAAREETPFRSVEELRERGLVGEKTFEQLRALVTVG